MPRIVLPFRGLPAELPQEAREQLRRNFLEVEKVINGLQLGGTGSARFDAIVDPAATPSGNIFTKLSDAINANNTRTDVWILVRPGTIVETASPTMGSIRNLVVLGAGNSMGSQPTISIRASGGWSLSAANLVLQNLNIVREQGGTNGTDTFGGSFAILQNCQFIIQDSPSGSMSGTYQGMAFNATDLLWATDVSFMQNWQSASYVFRFGGGRRLGTFLIGCTMVLYTNTDGTTRCIVEETISNQAGPFMFFGVIANSQSASVWRIATGAAVYVWLANSIGVAGNSFSSVTIQMRPLGKQSWFICNNNGELALPRINIDYFANASTVSATGAYYLSGIFDTLTIQDGGGTYSWAPTFYLDTTINIGATLRYRGFGRIMLRGNATITANGTWALDIIDDADSARSGTTAFTGNALVNSTIRGARFNAASGSGRPFNLTASSSRNFLDWAGASLYGTAGVDNGTGNVVRTT